MKKKNTTKKTMKNTINDVFNTIVNENNCNKELEEELIRYINSPYVFNCFYKSLNYKIKSTLKKMINEKFGNSSKLTALYVHYDFLSNHIEELCKIKEGTSCCCGDKSTFILDMYFNYIKTNKLPEENYKEDRFYIPKFGTYQCWMNYCDGLLDLYYGKSEKYLKAYNKLFYSKIRLYEHIVYSFYIKTKELDDDLYIGYTWDNSNSFKARVLDSKNKEFLSKIENKNFSYYIVKAQTVEMNKKLNSLYKPYKGSYKMQNENLYKIPIKSVKSVFYKKNTTQF